jgi:hypothetical protein
LSAYTADFKESMGTGMSSLLSLLFAAQQ